MVPTIVHRMILTLNDNVGMGDEVNGTENLGGSWFSPGSIGLRTFPNDNLHVVEERHSFTDAVF